MPDSFTADLSPARESTAGERVRAERTIARFATTEDEHRMFLEMCGLVPERPRKPRPAHTPELADAVPVREHIDRLREAGWTLTSIARESGVSYPTVTNLASQQPKRTSKATADAICALKIGER